MKLQVKRLPLILGGLVVCSAVILSVIFFSNRSTSPALADGNPSQPTTALADLSTGSNITPAPDSPGAGQPSQPSNGVQPPQSTPDPGNAPSSPNLLPNTVAVIPSETAPGSTDIPAAGTPAIAPTLSASVSSGAQGQPAEASNSIAPALPLVADVSGSAPTFKPSDPSLENYITAQDIEDGKKIVEGFFKAYRDKTSYLTYIGAYPQWLKTINSCNVSAVDAMSVLYSTSWYPETKSITHPAKYNVSLLNSYRYTYGNDPYNIMTLQVAFNDGSGSHEWGFVLVKVTADSPWVIHKFVA